MVFDISETDHNARRQNQVTMAAANVIKWKRIQLTNDEAGIENREKVFLGEGLHGDLQRKSSEAW